MEISIYVAVLCSAFMNAAWNSMVHAESDRHSIVLVMLLVEGALALCALPFVALPGPEAWGWLAGGTALRVVYTFVLLRAYARIELSRIYPIARGTAPIVLGLLGLALFGERLGARGTLAVLAITTGVKTGAIAGTLGTLSYLVALWAFTRAPAALVASLRETSVLFALFLARTTLREQVALRDWIGGVLIVAGAASLRL